MHRNSLVRLIGHLDMTIAVYHGRKAITEQLECAEKLSKFKSFCFMCKKG